MSVNASFFNAQAWWGVQGEWVQPPNFRRGGQSGVQRVEDNGATFYVKRQRNYLCRTWRYPLGCPTLLREWRNLLLYFRLGVPTARPVAFGMRRQEGNWEAVLVTAELENYVSLAQGLRQGYWSAQQRQQILLSVVDAVVPLHLASRKHGHLYSKEIFVRCAASKVQIALLDLELSRRHVTCQRAAQSDMRRLIRDLIALGVEQSAVEHMLERYAFYGLPLPQNFMRRCLV